MRFIAMRAWPAEARSIFDERSERADNRLDNSLYFALRLIFTSNEILSKIAACGVAVLLVRAGPGPAYCQASKTAFRCAHVMVPFFFHARAGYWFKKPVCHFAVWKRLTGDALP